MPVQIAEISLDSLLPQSALHLLPRRVNLIYGRNENGKTRLVEFILSSLFRSSGKMTLRPVDVSGRVRMSGLKDGADAWFTPRSRHKLEDDLQVNDAGLPPQLARLLVVKGAESELQADFPGGLGRTALNDYLSNQGLIDRILNRVPKITRQAQILDGTIAGTLAGDLKRRKETLERLVVADKLIADIDLQISDGPLGQLTDQLAELELAIGGQKTARQQYVNRLAADQAKLQQQSFALPSEEIQHLEVDIREEAYLIAEIKRLKGLCEEKTPILANYQWLEAALQTYQVSPEADLQELQWLLPALSAGGIIGTGVFALLDYPWLAFAFAAITLLFGFLAYRQLKRAAWAAIHTPENQRIAAEFERRFGLRCKGITDLLVRKNALFQEVTTLQTLEASIQTTTLRKQEITRQIDQRLKERLPDMVRSYSDRQVVLNELKEKRARLEEALLQVEIGLKTTPVQPVSGGDMNETIPFNPQTLADLESEITRMRAQIEDLKQQKISLKQRICDMTGGSVADDLDELIPALQDYHVDLEKSGKAITAEILAGMAVTQAMQELRAGEDSALQIALQSPLIRNPLKALTGRYDRIDLQGDHLEVSDAFQSFRLDELSTGAQEQVLLGLRIGLSSRLFSGQPLFLILDDAFQHSDWQRRPAMVDEVLHLAQAGWQIFYLTMDDHLRDLFLEKTPAVMGDDFLEFNMLEKK